MLYDTQVKTPKGGGGGGLPYESVLIRVVNQVLWSHLGYLGQNASLFSFQTIFLGTIKVVVLTNFWL